LLLFIEPDAKAQAALREALEQFLAKLEEGWNKLCEMNGGPPVRKVVTVSQPEPEYQDIIP
jgi:mannose/fructose-specific phosphotransferase system component IIA